MPTIFNKYFPGMYDEERLQSQPFKFISLPLYSALIFILYWFIYCPLMFVKVNFFYIRYKYGVWPKAWPYYFWFVALAVFLIIMAVLVYLWRLTPKKKNEMYEVSYVDGKEELSEDKKSIELNDLPERGEGAKDVLQNVVLPQEVDSICENTTPLTPRELFFRDLIESSNRSLNSSGFILNEQRFSTDSEQKTQEFFVASVSPKQTYLSNIFMFVNENDDKMNKATEKSVANCE